MKNFLSRLFALVLVCAITLVGCTSSPAGLTGNYSEDTLAVVTSLRNAIELPEASADKVAAQADARQMINEFIARYRRDGSVSNLRSFTTMRTALNALAGHYSSYPNRPLPDNLKQRVGEEFDQVELAIKRGV
ncbi:MAG: photosystem II protein Psb27 [Oscillatoriales cyanobacterium RM1_1_9]|nr:photosystem II protein Psb27 [Oscillatoriales cyanobacterium SM2_3_0]NJO45348.1 photosystem II protein Psb27 [Oscillatoriales cyanobacterium RM2_1_1]NJO70835.1 photosystem II protein Psb27 [Oscillatoriales cyanobacterium RM1_1_9]